jgi:predicted NACHT family NTPase
MRDELLASAAVPPEDRRASPDSPPLSLLVASGGAGKTTLLRSLAAEINESQDSRVMLIEADALKKLPKEQLRRSHVSSLFELCELHSMALTTAGAAPIKVRSSRNVFDLLLISGSLLILIDGIDELLSMMSSSFELVRFLTVVFPGTLVDRTARSSFGFL